MTNIICMKTWLKERQVKKMKIEKWDWKPSSLPAKDYEEIAKKYFTELKISHRYTSWDELMKANQPKDK